MKQNNRATLALVYPRKTTARSFPIPPESHETRRYGRCKTDSQETGAITKHINHKRGLTDLAALSQNTKRKGSNNDTLLLVRLSGCDMQTNLACSAHGMSLFSFFAHKNAFTEGFSGHRGGGGAVKDTLAERRRRETDSVTFRERGKLLFHKAQATLSALTQVFDNGRRNNAENSIWTLRYARG